MKPKILPIPNRRLATTAGNTSCAALMASMLVVGFSGGAVAYEDSNCQKLETVQISVEEDAPSWSEIDAARVRALDRSGQLAIAQVIGVRVESSREMKAEINNSNTDQQYRQMEQSVLKGLVRLKILEEIRKAGAGGGTTLGLRSEVTVCVPKPEFLLKAERDRAEKERRPPQQVDPNQATWFDPVTGEPRLWYSRSEGQRLEFFDNGGFHPRTGEKLVAVDRKLAGDWRSIVQREQKDAADRAQREQAAREAETARQSRLAKAPELCDRLAASPYDLDKPKDVVGVPWDGLRENPTPAVEACEAAVQRAPEERRYKYQLARALQGNEPKRAIPLLQALTRQNYRAAFDNYGWALIDTRVGRNDLAGAITNFRRGASLGDPDAMVSLATMLMKGRAAPQAPDEALRLLQKAATAGHQDALGILQRAADEQRQAEAQRLQNEQAAKAFLGIMGGALGAIGRR